jgi:uncharacterized protein
MCKVIVEKPDADRLVTLGVASWPIWTKEVSTFPWSYSSKEIAYILEGEVTVTLKDGTPVSFGAGDLVTFEAGVDCIWHVKKALKKHYHFD